MVRTVRARAGGAVCRACPMRVAHVAVLAQPQTQARQMPCVEVVVVV